MLELEVWGTLGLVLVGLKVGEKLGKTWGNFKVYRFVFVLESMESPFFCWMKLSGFEIQPPEALNLVG